MDVSKGEAAVDQFGKSANKMAREVAQAADKAGAAVGKIGDGAEKTAVQFNRQERSITESVKRATTQLELLGKTASQKLEFKINAQGLDATKFEPALQKLRELESQAVRAGVAASGSLDKMGISAGQTRMALAQLPMQFSDIFVSLQGGQNPMTVFLQQGAQIKDSFGGAGAAVKAMGGYVLGLINPFTIAAAAAGALAVAYYQGGKEAENYNKALILSGNIAGTTTAKMTDMARALGDGKYTQGAAAAAIAELAQSGVVASDQLQKFAAVAIDVERATGQAISKTADAFKELEKAPLEATIKLNDSLHYLTLGTYEQIKALTEQGRVTDAARLAMDTYADAMGNRAKQVTENAGALEKSWRAVGSAASWAWDKMLGLGRDVTGSAQLDGLKKTLADREARGPLNSAPGMSDAYDKGNKALRDQIALLEKLGSAQQKSATQNAADLKVVEAKTTWDKESEKFLSKQQQLKREILKTEVEGQALLKQGAITQEQYATRLANVRDKFKETNQGSATAGQSELASIRAKVIETQRYIDTMKSQGLEAAKQTEGEKLAAKYREELTGGLKGAARANKELALAQAEKLAGLQKEQAGIEGLLKAQKDFETARDREAVSRQSVILKIEESAQALEDEVAMYGKGKEAIEALSIARLEEKKAILLQFDGSDQRIQQIEDEIAARKRLAVAGDGMAALKMGTHTDQLLANAKEQASLYEDELKLTGMTALARAKVVAQRQVEIKYAKELAAIDKRTDLPEADREIERIKLREAQQIESSAVVNKVMQDDFQRTADQIKQSLTDALMRGFESGKDFGQNLRDTLVNMFKTLVLRPTIEGVLSPVSGAVNSVVNGVVGGGSDMLGMASGASSLYSNGAALGGVFASNAAYGAAIGTTSIGVGSQAAMLAAQTGTFGAAGVAATSSSAAVAGGVGSGAAGALAAIPVYGWIALAAVAAYAAFSGKGDSRFGSQAAYTPGEGAVSYGGPNGKGDDFGGVNAANKASALGIDSLLEKLGSADRIFRFSSGFESSENGKGFSYAGGLLNSGAGFGQGNDGMGYMNNRGSMNAEEAAASYANELKQATLQALQAASDIPKSITDKLAGVNIDGLDTKALDELVATIDKIIVEVDAFQGAIGNLPFKNLRDLSFDAASGLIAAAGGLEQLSAGVTGYMDNFATDGERRALKIQQITAALNAAGAGLTEAQVMGASRKDFRDFAGSVDVTTDEGARLYATLLSVQEGFASLTPELISVAGVTAGLPQIIIDGMLSGDAAGAGALFADTLMFGVQNALYSGFADQITAIISDQLVSPMVTALATGASISEAISGAAIESMVAQANAAAQALNAILTDPTFQSAMSQISAAVSGAVSGSISTAGRGYTPLQAPSRSSYGGGGGGGGSGGSSDRALSAWESATDAIVSTMKDLRQTLIGEGLNGFSNLQAQFAIEAAKASSGDLEAYKGLPGLAKALESANKDFASSALEQALMTARIIETLGNVVEAKTGAKVPGFAVGTNYVPNDMLAMIHQGEAIVPRAYNPAAGGVAGGQDMGEVVAELKALRAEVFELRKSASETAFATNKTSRTLDDAASGSKPLATMEVTA